ncbi:luciferase family protein [uncultured Pedobacter sp.]|uniref:luciferase domain-containing protein n=1 Tax=uncultured Pedobacter sp. TaxID=246139 RepID=UPI0025F1979B|nr:luciferase family protein [uncultured Pedobacter sp.]
MFHFIVYRLNFLKGVPLFALIYDSCLKIAMFLAAPERLGWFDDIENEVLSWDGTNVSLHKFGGTQFNYGRKEIGHLHSNGLLDILVGRQVKQELLASGKAEVHHIFKESGWISFYILTEKDLINAKCLLKEAYQSRM